SATVCQGAADGLAGIAGAAFRPAAFGPTSGPGVKVPAIACRAAPVPAGVEAPGCSPTVTVAGADPVLVTLTVWVALPCQATVLLIDVTLACSRPAVSDSVAGVTQFAATVTGALALA